MNCISLNSYTSDPTLTSFFSIQQKEDKYKAFDELYASKVNTSFLKKIINASKSPEPAKTKAREYLHYAKRRTQWTKALHLEETLFQEFPKSAIYLLDTRLAISIVGLATTFPKNGHAIQVFTDQESGEKDLYIKVQGNWKSVEQIQENFTYNTLSSFFYPTSTSNLEKRSSWNYISVDGLIPIDRYIGDILVPAGILEKNQLQKLQEIALPSSQDNANHFLQMVASPAPNGNSLFSPSSFLFRGWNQIKPYHFGIRLIDSQGNVLSSGIAIYKEEQALIQSLGVGSTINSAPTLIDEEEFKRSPGKLTTTLAITEDQHQKICNYLIAKRTESVRFNYLFQNCTKLTKNILKIAGVNINNQIPLGELLLRPIPGSSALFHGIQKIAEKVNQLALKIFSASIYQITSGVYCFLFHAVALPINFLGNIILYFLGGSNKSKSLREEQISSTPREIEDPQEIVPFDSLLNSFTSFFRSEHLKVYHCKPLIEWMLKQEKGTFLAPYPGIPGFHMLPPEEELSAKQAQARLDRLRRVYV